MHSKRQTRTGRRTVATVLAIGLAGAALTAGVSSAATGAARGGRGHHGRHHGMTMRVASGYLGIERHTLRREVAGGRSLDEIAGATPGRSAKGLLTAELAARGRSAAGHRERIEARLARKGLPAHAAHPRG